MRVVPFCFRVQSALCHRGTHFWRVNAENSIHVSHVIVDGGLAGERIKQRLSDFEERVKEGKLINIESVTDAYMFLYNQNKDAWTFELDVRTSQEKW